MKAEALPGFDHPTPFSNANILDALFWGVDEISN